VGTRNTTLRSWKRKISFTHPRVLGGREDQKHGLEQGEGKQLDQKGGGKGTRGSCKFETTKASGVGRTRDL